MYECHSGISSTVYSVQNGCKKTRERKQRFIIFVSSQNYTCRSMQLLVYIDFQFLFGSLAKQNLDCPKSSKEKEQIVWQAQNLTLDICNMYILATCIVIFKQIKNGSGESGKKLSYTCTMYRCWMEQLCRNRVKKRNTKFPIIPTILTTKASMLVLTAILTVNKNSNYKIGRTTSIIITLTVLSLHQIYIKKE